MTDAMIGKRIEELFNGDYYCAESVVKVIAEAGGLASADAVRMATGFCSGMARTCGQCGAVSGAVMGLGLYAGRRGPGGDYDAVYTLTQEFLNRFETMYGSVNCFDLVRCDFATPEGSRKYRDEKGHETCVAMAVFAARIALSLLCEYGYLEDKDRPALA